MKHGLTEGCLGCRCLAEGKRAQGHPKGCRARLEAEIAKTEDGRARLTQAYVRGWPRDGGGPAAGAAAPAAVPVPPRPDGVQDEPMDGRGASRKRRAEDAGHEADDAGRGGAQSNPASMVEDSMPELRREAEALGADAVALAEAYSSAASWRIRIECSCGYGSAFGMGSGAVSQPGQSRKRGFDSTATHQARRVGRTAGAGQASLGVCKQSGRIANRARWSRACGS